MDDRPSPEKDLLKLIEETKEGKEDIISQARTKREVRSLFSWSALKGRWSFFKEGFSGRRRTKEPGEDLKSFNNLLGAGVLFILILSGVRYYFSTKGLNMHFIEKPISPLKVGKIDITSAKPLDFYLEEIRKRDIFSMGEAPKIVSLSKKKEILPPSEAEKIYKRYKLVGVSWSDDPDVMIEDTKANKTYFLKRGGRMGEVEVKDIFEDKVILEYKGQEIELK